jgi:pumilio homology domain family member 6
MLTEVRLPSLRLVLRSPTPTLDKSATTSALLSAISMSYPADEISKEPHPIDLAHTSRIYKTLLQGGQYNHKTQSIESSSNWNAGKFAVDYINNLGSDVVVSMCTKGEQNGCFVVAELCQALVSASASTTDEEEKKDLERARKALKGWFGDGVRQDIESSDAKGKKVLLEKLAVL